MTLRIAAHFLIFGNVWLRKIGATAHEQQFEDVMITGAPIKLRRGARAFSKIVKLLWLGRFEITARGEAVHEKVVAQFSCLPAVIGVEIVVIQSGAAEVYVAMSCKVGTGTRSDVEHPAETIAVFRSESAGHQINGLENLRAHAGTELGLRVVQEGNAVDEFVQRKFSATNSQEIVVAIAGAGHQIINQIVSGVCQRSRDQIEILSRGRISGTSRFLIYGERASL